MAPADHCVDLGRRTVIAADRPVDVHGPFLPHSGLELGVPLPDEVEEQLGQPYRLSVFPDIAALPVGSRLRKSANEYHSAARASLLSKSSDEELTSFIL